MGVPIGVGVEKVPSGWVKVPSWGGWKNVEMRLN